MKICIPTATKDGKNAQVFDHFGSAPCFTICDLEKDTVEVIDNGNQHHSHGMCQPMESIKGKNIYAIVCSAIGVRAIQHLNQEGIKVYKSQPGTVMETISQFMKGSLQEFTAEGGCNKHNCHE
jgi:predicted Fe-Mo cluster-binding NifX family protein